MAGTGPGGSGAGAGGSGAGVPTGSTGTPPRSPQIDFKKLGLVSIASRYT